jgi:hypothetical protein
MFLNQTGQVVSGNDYKYHQHPDAGNSKISIYVVRRGNIFPSKKAKTSRAP